MGQSGPHIFQQGVTKNHLQNVGEQPQLGDLLTMVISHLLTGMILQKPLTKCRGEITPLIGVKQPQLPIYKAIYRRCNSIYKWGYRGDMTPVTHLLSAI